MKDRLKSLPAEFTLPVSHAGGPQMTTEAQRLAEKLEFGVLLGDDRDKAAALLRRQEKALMQAREALENLDGTMFRYEIEALAAINELLGEQT